MRDASKEKADLPEPTEISLHFAAWLIADLKLRPRKERLAILREMSETLAWFRDNHRVIRIRPLDEMANMDGVSRRAYNLWERQLPLLLRMVDK